MSSSSSRCDAGGEESKRELDDLRPKAEDLVRQLQQSSEQATEARTLLASKPRESLRELSQIDGAKVCRHCGQALTTVDHLGEEKTPSGRQRCRQPN